ncbi:hypothetical protein AgCh_002422 [Apium graveolens]
MSSARGYEGGRTLEEMYKNWNVGGGSYGCGGGMMSYMMLNMIKRSSYLTNHHMTSAHKQLSMHLTIRNKIGFVDGTIDKPIATDVFKTKALNRRNNMLISWLLGVLDQDIARRVLYFTSARDIWLNLEERFGQASGTLLYKSVDDESEGEFLKLKATIEWLLCDNTAPVNKKVMYEEFQNDKQRRKRLKLLKYETIVGIDDLKKEVDKRGKDEVVTSRTSQSSPRETARKGGIFTKQDIDSLFMEVSQSPSMNPLVLGSLKDGLYYLDAKHCPKICHQAKQVQNSFSSSVSKPNKFFNRTNYIKADGTVERFKERLVSKGYNQKWGIELEEPFSTVVKMTTVRCLIVVASHKGWKLHHLDVNNAFLHGDLLKEVFSNLRMIIHCSSRKTNDSITIVAVYVDDIILTSNDAQGLTLTQRKFTQELLKEANITDFKTKATPQPLNLNLSADKGELYTDLSYYRMLVGHEVNNNVLGDPQMNVESEYPNRLTMDFLGLGTGMNSVSGGGGGMVITVVIRRPTHGTGKLPYQPRPGLSFTTPSIASNILCALTILVNLHP